MAHDYYSFYNHRGQLLRRDALLSLEEAHADAQVLANKYGCRVDYATSREIAAFTGHHSEEQPGYSVDPEGCQADVVKSLKAMRTRQPTAAPACKPRLFTHGEV